jgi:hypothetical protein
MIIKTTALHCSGRDRAMRNSETHVPLWRQFQLPQLLITGTFLATTAASMGQPVITTQPQSQTNIASTTATFTVEAAGTPPLGYQWQRDTGYLDFGDLAGRTNATLVLTNVGSADAYNYRAVVTNDSGAITSAVASLTLVYPPKITRLSNYVASASVGASASMRVWASGTAPLSYQWWFKIATLPGQTNYTLNLSCYELF